MNLVGVQRSCTSNPLASHTESWFRNSKLRFQGQTEFTLPFLPTVPPVFWKAVKAHLLQHSPHALTAREQHWNKGQQRRHAGLSPRQIFVREKSLTPLFP